MELGKAAFTAFCPNSELIKALKSLPPSPLKDYAACYANQIVGYLRITRCDTSLTIFFSNSFARRKFTFESPSHCKQGTRHNKGLQTSVHCTYVLEYDDMYVFNNNMGGGGAPAYLPSISF